MSELNQIETGTPLKPIGSFWPMTVLAVIFVFLYVAALIGWLRPVSDLTMIARLEPILFLIFGYYFGRLPNKQNEQRSNEENMRITKKLEVAQHAKEQAQAEREAIQEKIRNAKVALRSELIELDAEKRLNRTNDHIELGPRAVETAINILNS